jgi:phosphoglycolate phosphatase-like HAD superfamily hydrolase
VRVCLFDIDGTLISTGGAGKAAMDAALRDEFGILQPIVPGSMSGRTDRGIAREQFLLHRIDDTPENWGRLVSGYIRHLPHYLRQCVGRVLPGISQLLDRLGNAGMAIGLLTGNVPEGARIKLSHYELFHHFPFGSFGDRHFTRNEIAHEAWRIVCEHVGEDVAAEEILVIGDTPLDVECARAIGARVVAVATGVHSREELAATSPDLLLDDLSDAAEVWRLLDSRGLRE